MQTNKYLLVSLILLFSGFLFSGIAAYLYIQQASLERSGVQTEGIVIKMVANSDSDGTTYAPIVRFATQGGRTFEIQSTYYSNPPAYEIGQRVTIIYPPEQPAKAQIKGDGRLLIIIFGAVGGMDLFISLIFVIHNLSKNFRDE